MYDRVYYWEHNTDESRYLRSASARKMAEALHSCGGEAGVIIDDGGPLRIAAVRPRDSISRTTQALEQLSQ